MYRRMLVMIAGGLLTLASAGKTAAWQADRYYHYPYYYFPHSYAPNYQPWPDPRTPFQRPPDWMAYPPYHDPGFRYELWRPMRYYRGHHFWLDQF